MRLQIIIPIVCFSSPARYHSAFYKSGNKIQELFFKDLTSRDITYGLLLEIDRLLPAQTYVFIISYIIDRGCHIVSRNQLFIGISGTSAWSTQL